MYTTINSIRKYKLIFFLMEKGTYVESMDIALDDIHDLEHPSLKETELQYSLQEQIDAILDMQLHVVMPIIIDRGTKEIGLIKRIS